MNTTLDRKIIKENVIAYIQKEKSLYNTIYDITLNVGGIMHIYVIRDIILSVSPYYEIIGEKKQVEDIEIIIDKILKATQS